MDNTLAVESNSAREGVVSFLHTSMFAYKRRPGTEAVRDTNTKQPK